MQNATGPRGRWAVYGCGIASGYCNRGRFVPTKAVLNNGVYLDIVLPFGVQ